MPPAARITDMHTCPMVSPGPVPHVGGPIIKGSTNVLTGMLPQARVSDQCICMGPPDIITKGSATVMVNGRPAARLGDQTAHGGIIVVGLPTVMIGDSGGSGGGGGAGAGQKGSGTATDHTTDIAPGWADLKYSNLASQRETLIAAAQHGVPFCEICAKAAHAGENG